MNEKNLERFRRALRDHRDTLLEWLASDSSDKKIHLGGSQKAEILQIISELKGALERIDSGEFGKCEECGGQVEAKQLEYDFTSCVCLDHYSVSQLRTLESELELVSKVQRDLLPCKVPSHPEMALAVHTETARIVGGDYYDFFHFKDGAQGLAIADVMDKGLPASILMSNLQASLRILGPDHESPVSLAERLNKLFRHNLNLIKFISIFLAALDFDTRELRYCNAGHHPPIWWKASSNSFNWLNPTGPALGLTPEVHYGQEFVRVNAGDLMVFYTDGLVEAGNHNGEEFGEERLLVYLGDHIQAPPDELLRGLLENARRFAGRFYDDVTLMILRFQ